MALDKIIVENFKAFKGEHIFDLKQLNIFTGANNSGKSTLIKAISLFSKGLEKGDFPSIDLYETNYGSFKDLVNRDSGADNFKIGFFIEIGEKKIPFKVMYEFVEGKVGSIDFSNLTIFTKEKEIFFAFYNPEYFKVTYDNFEMIIPDGEEEHFEQIKHNFDRPFLSPSLDGDPSRAYSKLNLDELNLIIGDLTENDYSDFIGYLKELSVKKQYWWAELFREDDFINLEKVKITDLLSEFSLDYFTNLAEYDLKGRLYWGKNYHADYGLILGYSYNKEHLEEWKKSNYKNEKQIYDELKDELKYNSFIFDVINPIFKEIEKSLDFFKGDKVIHYKYSEIYSNLVLNSKTSFIFDFFANKSDHFQPTREMLSFFGIDGYIEVKLISNKYLKINLVIGLNEIDREIEKIEEDERKILDDETKKKDYPKIIRDIYTRSDFNVRYKNNPRIEINELGRGLSSIMRLILSLLSVRMSVSNNRVKYNDFKGREIPRLIIIEEPEVFLHPDWQSNIIEMISYFIDYCDAKRFNIEPILIIETHSEYIIRKTQYLVARNNIDRRNIKINYFNNNNKESLRFEINFNDDGSLTKDFSSGFLDEADNIALALYKLQRNNLN